MSSERCTTHHICDCLQAKLDAVVKEREALTSRNERLVALLRELDSHPRADYPLSLDKRIKQALATEPKEQP